MSEKQKPALTELWNMTRILQRAPTTDCHYNSRKKRFAISGQHFRAVGPVSCALRSPEIWHASGFFYLFIFLSFPQVLV